ncbi:hypothetical protein CDV31_010800 [Fusarium ambrosium]|uniref:glutaminase n=1 Tax=Fusarium ambrosium TaxID=131363 RepID=A0A428TL90_9HYPO|nr:hypothetical protein CDV31_010800 [Fusarium ambrosium]
MLSITIGVLALQGGFSEHVDLVHKAAEYISSTDGISKTKFNCIEVRTEEQLAQCNGLIIPGGESTTISFVAAQSGLLEPLRHFVKVQKRPVWGTCAGLILLSDEANATKKGGQELIGGLAVRVHRNHFGRQIESFESGLDLPFLQDGEPFPGVFIRAPVVEEIISTSQDERPPVQVLAKLPGRVDKMKPGLSQANTKDDSGDIIAVRQGNILGMSFHPELTKDARIHVWWLREILHQQ